MSNRSKASLMIEACETCFDVFRGKFDGSSLNGKC